MIKSFDEFLQLNEGLNVDTRQYNKHPWQSGIDATETPVDGTYDGEICGCVMTLDGKDYNLECGPRAHFKGLFRVEDGHVYMMEGTKQYLGNRSGYIKIDDEKGSHIAVIQTKDADGRWCAIKIEKKMFNYDKEF